MASQPDRSAAASRANSGLRRIDIDDPQWSGFVAACPGALPFHHPAWAKLLAECYGFAEPFALVVEQGEEITAGLPVLEVRGPVGGRRWLSLPFTDYCPPLAGDAPDPDLLARELDLTRRRAGVSRLQVRAALPGPGVQMDVAAVTHTLRLADDPHAVYRTFKRSQVQRNIARAEREKVVVRRAESRADVVDVFYALHLGTRQRQGVPVQPRRFFDLLWRWMIEPGLGFVLLAYAGRVPIAGAVFLTWSQTITYKFGASDARFWGLRPNHLVFWTATRWACERGYQVFDFGRTDLANRGLREFKNGWGAQERPLIYSSIGTHAHSSARGRSKGLLELVIRSSPPWVCRSIGEALYKYAT